MLGSPRMSSAFTSRRVPRPWQSGQAPKGELKENCRGSSSGSERPHTGQAKRSENSRRSRCRSVVPCDLDQPSAILSAVSIESVSRPRSSARTTSRSTTTAMSWFCRRFSVGHRAEVVGLRRPRGPARSRASARPRTARGTRPFAPAPSGRATSIRVSAGQPSTVSVICAGALPRDRRAVVGAVRHADPRPEEAQVVVDLGDGADGGSRVLPRGLLLDGDGRREPLDRVHVGLLHQPEELPRVGRERFDVSPLAFGVDGVEGERRLPRAGQPGDDGQLVAGDGDGDVLEVVLAGAPHHQIFLSHSPERYPKLLPRVNGFPFRASVSTIYLPS